MTSISQVNILANEYGIGRGKGMVFGIWADARTNIEALKSQRQELQEASEGIIALAGEEDRDLSEEELEEINSNVEKAERFGKQISAQERVLELSAGQGRKTKPDESASARNINSDGNRRTVPASPRADPRTGGFRSLGEFAANVYGASNRNEGSINRLMAMNEGVGEDGGFLVPPEFRDGIMKIVEGEDSLLSRCDMSTTSSNSVTQNVDETTPWGVAGITSYWEGEGGLKVASGAKFGQTTLRLNKLYARIDVTDELLEDAPQLDNYLRVKTPEVMTSVINLAIISGNGVGKPLGFMNSGALVTVAAETSQPADTIHHRNIVKMQSRMYAPYWTGAIWLMNQDVWPQLQLMSFRDVGAYPSTATGTAVPVYLPPNGLMAGAPFGSLMGRPILPLQGMETLGDLGDIALVNLKQYRAITKAGGMKVDTSIHLKFDTDETVFRFVFRLAGAPWMSAPITPRDGNNTMSAFVTLASR